MASLKIPLLFTQKTWMVAALSFKRHEKQHHNRNKLVLCILMYFKGILKVGTYHEKNIHTAKISPPLAFSNNECRDWMDCPKDGC